MTSSSIIKCDGVTVSLFSSQNLGVLNASQFEEKADFIQLKFEAKEALDKRKSRLTGLLIIYMYIKGQINRQSSHWQVEK